MWNKESLASNKKTVNKECDGDTASSTCVRILVHIYVYCTLHKHSRTSVYVYPRDIQYPCHCLHTHAHKHIVGKVEGHQTDVYVITFVVFVKEICPKKVLELQQSGFSVWYIRIIHSIYGWMYRPPNIHPLTLGKRLLDLFFCVSGWCRECRADSFSLQILEIYVARGSLVSSLHTLLLPRLSTIFP